MVMIGLCVCGQNLGGRLIKQIWQEFVIDHPARMKTDEIFYKQLGGVSQSL